MQKLYSIPIQRVNFNCLNIDDVTLSMARVDTIHKLASGNKIYKLRPIIEYAKANNYKQILSFGGAYSNHIHALALMSKQHDIEPIALIRGEEKYAENPTLSDAINAGMRLEFVTRQEYKQRNDSDYLAVLQSRFPQALIVAEGGSSELAVNGCAQMTQDINQSESQSLDKESDILTIASGTGATAAGLICGLTDRQKLIAYSVLKDESLESRIDSFVNANNLVNGYMIDKKDKYSMQSADFGGYAKLDKSMLDFILSWLEQTGILLDPIYTSKMCRRVIQQIEAGEFASGQSITLIHSGGLQGWRGMQQRVESLAGEQSWKMIVQYLDDMSLS